VTQPLTIVGLGGSLARSSRSLAAVVRVATRFTGHATPQRARDCEESAERVAAAAVS
jgi:hypothetical protein